MSTENSKNTKTNDIPKVRIVIETGPEIGFQCSVDPDGPVQAVDVLTFLIKGCYAIVSILAGQKNIDRGILWEFFKDRCSEEPTDGAFDKAIKDKIKENK